MRETKRRYYAALVLATVVALSLFWRFSPFLPPESWAVPMAVLSGPTIWLYYARFASVFDPHHWQAATWYSLSLLASLTPALIALRVQRAESRIAGFLLATILWLFFGALAVATMTI
ncbi:MAG: hypothetical protein KJN97_15325 [Deltaproteobacteria bacterium]|nr:hypothetical protein [Deltaproteobacteria bacterium]